MCFAPPPSLTRPRACNAAVFYFLKQVATDLAAVDRIRTSKVAAAVARSIFLL